MSVIKKAFKSFIYHLIPKKGGFANVKVIGGPVKGVVLRLDIRLEGSYWLGNYDKWIFDRIPFDRYIKSAHVCWDCGAYVGYYSGFFRKIVGESGQVHSFEASQQNFSRLKEMPDNNKWTNVFIHNLAVGADHSILEFVDNRGGSSGPYNAYNVEQKYEGEASQLIITKVPCCGLDELVYEKGITVPDFLKLDLETAEEFALHNGDRLFREKKPFILLELHGERAKTSAGIFFEKYNYEGILLSGFGERRHVIRSLADFQKIDGVPHMVFCQPLN